MTLTISVCLDVYFFLVFVIHRKLPADCQNNNFFFLLCYRISFVVINKFSLVTHIISCSDCCIKIGRCIVTLNVKLQQNIAQ